MNKKEERWRMEGANFALRVAKEKGVDGLEAELKRRGVLGLSLAVSHKAAEEVYNDLARRTVNTVKTVTLWTLFNAYGWKKVRLQRFNKLLDKYSEQLLQLDKFGNAYVTFLDMANVIKEEYGISPDMSTLEEMEAIQKDAREKMIRFDLVLDALNKCGLEEVTAELERKVMEGRLG